MRCVPSSLISCDLREDLMWEELNREGINMKCLNWEDLKVERCNAARSLIQHPIVQLCRIDMACMK